MENFDIDKFINAMDKLTAYAMYLDKIRYAIEVSNNKCGDCQHWMLNSCPKEVRINGRNHGPTMSGLICSKFIINERDLKLKYEIQQGVRYFAAIHGFKDPFPIKNLPIKM